MKLTPTDKFKIKLVKETAIYKKFPRDIFKKRSIAITSIIMKMKIKNLKMKRILN